MENKVYICKSTGMAVYLIKRGCYCYKVEIDKFDNTRLIYIFVKDYNCRLAIEDFMVEVQKIKEQKNGDGKTNCSASC